MRRFKKPLIRFSLEKNNQTLLGDIRSHQETSLGILYVHNFFILSEIPFENYN
jgi:hypothetical protein